ncbi:NAD-dependent epimerase [Arenibacter amylolyticus]|uniref:NAD-dependent epimerase n=1 Tax=Arenibacter amylolyticus TaxID=1406873 RepID=UPI000A3D363D|nr:NAD-dependent epimerase [Arenibacter amylolyticus]
MQKILVTGAAGFIGYYVAEAYSKQGIEVVGIDNINDYYDVNLKYARLKESGIQKELIIEGLLVKSEKYESYKFAKIDITDYQSLNKLFVGEKFTHVINLAAQAGVRYSIENPHSYVQSNLIGFLNILECCRHNQIKHLVYASSSSVYGHNKKIPFSEEDNVDHPVSLYAATKKSNELMAFTYSHLYNIQTTGLRFFTVYGPWGRPDMAPMLFADAIVNGRAIKVFNKGEMRRDFTYIDDIVEGIVKAVGYNNDKKPPYDVFNIGNSTPIDLMEFIECMEKALGLVALKEMLPMQPGDVKVTYADTTKLEGKIGYKPKLDLKSGLNYFVTWYKEYYNCQ